MLRTIAVLLLSVGLAQAQVTTRPPGSTGGTAFDGGTITAPILGPVGCTDPAYSFTGAPTVGVCSAAGTSATMQSGTAVPLSEVTVGSSSGFLRFSDASGNFTTFVVRDNEVEATNESGQGFTLGSAFTITIPTIGPVGCTNPAYSFDGATTAGLCLDGTAARVQASGAQPRGVLLADGTQAYALFFHDSVFDGFIANPSSAQIETASTTRVTVSTTAVTSTLPFLALVGTVANPGIAFSADPDTGFTQPALGYMKTVLNGDGVWQLNSAEEQLDSGVQRTWSSGDIDASASDTGLARSAAAVVKVTNGSTGSGSLLVADGSSAAPAVAFASQPALGFFALGTNIMGLTAAETADSGFALKFGAGNTVFAVGNDGVCCYFTRMLSSGQFGWTSSSSDALQNPDTGLERAAAGVVRVTNGNDGATVGYFLSGVSVEANTGTKAPALDESGELYTNTGDADGSIINLPDNPTIGTQFRVALTVAQTVTINAASGETIQDAGTNAASRAASAIGDTIHLIAVTGGSGAVWMVVSKTGTWS
jgi:hypothetical protein